MITRRCRGVSLVEVLVSLVILSVSLLGFLSLQLKAAKLTREALHSSQQSLRLRGTEAPKYG